MNQDFEVELFENGTTGFIWEIEKAPDFIEFKEKRNVVGDSAPGSGGKCIFVFSVLKKGNGELRLRLKRPWEPNEIDHKAIQVNVQE